MSDRAHFLLPDGGRRAARLVGAFALLGVLLISAAAGSLGTHLGPSPLPHESLLLSSSRAAATLPGKDPFGLAVGDQVDVVAPSLDVRQAPSQSAVLFTVEVQFRQGVILAGSALADGYVWWEVSWDNNFTGWSAEGSNSTDWIQNLTGHTVTFNRAAAMAYATEYWNVVTSDGYFWNGPDSYVSYAQGTSVVGLSGDDCAHFVSQVIGDQPNQPGGGLNIPSRVPPTYGEPSAPDLGNDLLSWGWAVQVNGTDQLEPGDVINYEWNPPDGTWDHIAVYLGNGNVAAHTDSNYGINWTYGGAYAYRFIHILATATGGSGVDHPQVTLALTPRSGGAPLVVGATATVVGGSESYASYVFAWGDGTSTTSSTPTASHTYATAGSYRATVKVIDSLGATGWAANQSVSVSSGGSPVAVSLGASATSGTAPLAVTFAAAPSGGSGTYSSFAWNFGDGVATTTTSPDATHTYTVAGTFSANVQVTDSLGATATSTSVSVDVSAVPPVLTVALSANTTTGSSPLVVGFSASASGGTGSYTSYAWSFGDGSTLTTSLAQATHTYSKVGDFPATVTVSDGSGSATSTVLSVTVTAGTGTGTPPPLAATLVATATSGTAPLSVTFDLSITGGTAPYSILWNFDDGNDSGPASTSSTSASVSHTFTQAGDRLVTATVVDASGRVVAPTVQVSVAAAPTPTSPSTSSQPSPMSQLTSGWGLVALIVVGAMAAVAVGALAARRRGPGSGGAPDPAAEFPGYWAGPPPSG